MEAIKRDDPNALYELGEQMGKGSYGSVFRAKNKRTGKEVAIKIIDTTEQEGGLKEVVKEINFLVDCDHENVVRYYDSFLKDKELWVR